MILLTLLLSQDHLYQLLMFSFLKLLIVKQLTHLFPLPSSKYNSLHQLDNIKVDVTLLDMVVVPEQKKHLKIFMEGKDSIVANLSEEVDEEYSTVNKVGVHNFRHPIKKTPYFISTNIM
jgi:hypothetical protein